MERGDINSIQEYRDRLANFSNEFDLGLFLYILRRSIVWLFLCLVVAILLGFIYLRYTPNQYTSRTVIQLAEDDQADKILNVQSISEDNKPEAKVELIRSRLLIGRSLRELPIKVSYYAKGQILTNEHYGSSPYQVELLSLYNPDWQDKPIDIKFSGPGTFAITYGGNTYDNLEVGKDVETNDFKFILSVSDWELLQKNQDEYDLYFIINSLNSLTNRFSDGLEVRILNNTARTIEISFTDKNPYITKDFVRTHANEFIRFDLEKRRQSDESVLTFLDQQIDTVYNRLKESEVNLNAYKQLNKINNLEGVSQMYLQRLSEFEGDIVTLDIEERLLNEVEGLTRKSTNEVEIYNLIPLVAGSKYETALSKMLEKLHELLIDREEALYSVTQDNDMIKVIDNQIGIQKNVILQTISALRDQLDERKTRLSTKLAETEGTYYNIPQKELEYARLQRLFSINDKYYTLLLEKSIEYKISKEGYVSNNQILEESRTPVLPVSPKPKLVWFTFILSGFLLGMLLIALRYLLHNKITSMNDIVRASSATINGLGIVPKFKEDIPVSMLIVDKNPRSMIAESFRSIRTNLQFFDKEEGPKIAAITSTISGEGKTFVALNLAGIIAFSGKRVIVCDLDMRKPKIHKGFSTENHEGMSTLLIGRGSVKDSIRKSQLANLDFITAGPIPPNPSELIISHRMKDIIDELKNSYDVIILDTPPVGLVTDAVSLLSMADYPIYIFRSDYSKKIFIQVADKLINESHIKVSAILNGVDMDRNRYSYKYSYGYGYGYGYGAGGYYDEQSGKKSKSGLFSKIFRKRL
ncbi:MAG: polysaccharide biosynthesis tyrosine autokinase [Flavobacteriales bacterium]|nr:polysaccharide biosynthesis tyrosine autokinase [Flavobacteriales bacterium]